MLFQIQKLIDEEINPGLQLHRGAIELIDVDNNKVFITFKGGCQGCAAASQTLKLGVEKRIKDKFPEITEVIDITRHEEGKKPFIPRQINN